MNSGKSYAMLVEANKSRSWTTRLKVLRDYVKAAEVLGSIEELVKLSTKCSRTDKLWIADRVKSMCSDIAEDRAYEGDLH